MSGTPRYNRQLKAYIGAAGNKATAPTNPDMFWFDPSLTGSDRVKVYDVGTGTWQPLVSVINSNPTISGSANSVPYFNAAGEFTSDASIIGYNATTRIFNINQLSITQSTDIEIVSTTNDIALSGQNHIKLTGYGAGTKTGTVSTLLGIGADDKLYNYTFNDIMTSITTGYNITKGTIGSDVFITLGSDASDSALANGRAGSTYLGFGDTSATGSGSLYGYFGRSDNTSDVYFAYINNNANQLTSELYAAAYDEQYKTTRVRKFYYDADGGQSVTKGVWENYSTVEGSDSEFWRLLYGADTNEYSFFVQQSDNFRFTLKDGTNQDEFNAIIAAHYDTNNSYIELNSSRDGTYDSSSYLRNYVYGAGAVQFEYYRDGVIQGYLGLSNTTDNLFRIFNDSLNNESLTFSLTDSSLTASAYGDGTITGTITQLVGFTSVGKFVETDDISSFVTLGNNLEYGTHNSITGIHWGHSNSTDSDSSATYNSIYLTTGTSSNSGENHFTFRFQSSINTSTPNIEIRNNSADAITKRLTATTRNDNYYNTSRFRNFYYSGADSQSSTTSISEDINLTLDATGNRISRVVYGTDENQYTQLYQTSTEIRLAASDSTNADYFYLMKFRVISNDTYIDINESRDGTYSSRSLFRIFSRGGVNSLTQYYNDGNAKGQYGYYASTDDYLIWNNINSNESLLFRSADNSLQATSYGDGTITGTPTTFAAWDVSGKFIEVDEFDGLLTFSEPYRIISTDASGKAIITANYINSDKSVVLEGYASSEIIGDFTGVIGATDGGQLVRTNDIKVLSNNIYIGAATSLTGAKLITQSSSSTQSAIKAYGTVSQTANILEVIDSTESLYFTVSPSGTTIYGQMTARNELVFATAIDPTTASNNSIFLSSTTGELAKKNSTGTVNAL